MPRYDDEVDRMGHLLDGFSGQLDGSIERAEARGQKDLVKSEDLPIDMRPSREEIAEHTGIQFHENINDLFVRVTLPEGWRKLPTDHSMWSQLVDERGRERAAIFYKAAFYDRSAHITFGRRYSARTKYGDNCEVTKVLVQDAGKTIAEIEPDPKLETYEQEKLGAAWLSGRFPEWESVWAYWDAP